MLVDTDNPPPVPAGYATVRAWRFVRHCSSTGCTTTLLRPSILPGSKQVFRYPLHATGSAYIGRLNLPGVCYGPTKVLAPGSIVDHEVITIRPTRTKAGKVVAFSGAMVIKSAPSRWGRAEGCVASGYQKASIASPVWVVEP